MEVRIAFGEGVAAYEQRSGNGALGGGGEMMRGFRSSANYMRVFTYGKPRTRKQGKRGNLSGWCASVKRRLRDYLGRIDWVKFAASGHCLALNLTYGTMPTSAAVSADILDRYFRSLKYRGLVGAVWVMEYQIRGVPHFHILCAFSSKVSRDDLVSLWLRTAASTGPNKKGQLITPIYNAAGFAKYQQKHLSKSVLTAQRGGFPDEWNHAGARVWGHRGGIPLVPDVAQQWNAYDFRLNDFYFQLRRVCRRHAVACVRSRAPLYDVNKPNLVRYGPTPFTPPLTRCGIRPPQFLQKYQRKNGKTIYCYDVWQKELTRRRRSGRGRLRGDCRRSWWRKFGRTGQLPLMYDGDGLVHYKEDRAEQHQQTNAQLPAVSDLPQHAFLSFKEHYFAGDDVARGSFAAMDKIACRISRQQSFAFVKQGG